MLLLFFWGVVRLFQPHTTTTTTPTPFIIHRLARLSLFLCHPFPYNCVVYVYTTPLSHPFYILCSLTWLLGATLLVGVVPPPLSLSLYAVWCVVCVLLCVQSLATVVATVWFHEPTTVVIPLSNFMHGLILFLFTLELYSTISELSSLFSRLDHLVEKTREYSTVQ